MQQDNYATRQLLTITKKILNAKVHEVENMEHLEGPEIVVNDQPSLQGNNSIDLGDYTAYVFDVSQSHNEDCYKDDTYAVEVNSDVVAGNKVEVGSSTNVPVEQGAGEGIAESKNVRMLTAEAESLLQLPRNADELRDNFMNSNQVVMTTQIISEVKHAPSTKTECASSSFPLSQIGPMSSPKNEPVATNSESEQDSEKEQKNNFNCRLCEHVYHQPEVLDRHYLDAHDFHMAYQCWRCPYQTAAFMSMERHMDFCGTSSQIRCAPCLEINLNKLVSNENPARRYCVDCGVNFDNEELLTSHERTIHSEMEACSVDQWGNIMECEDAKPPVKFFEGTSKEQVLCSECGDAFENVTVMLAHKADSHLIKKREDSNPVSNHSADMAEVVAKRPRLLIPMIMDHLYSKQQVDVSDGPVPAATNPIQSSCVLYACPYTAEGCTYKTTKKQRMEKHKDTHKDRYLCDKCDFKCKKLKLLRSHVSSEHPNQKIPCPHADSGCKYETIKNSSMNSHLKYRHSNKLSCNLCDFKCSVTTTLRAHYQEIHGDMSYQSFLCPLCGRKFRFNQRLQIHLRIHRNDRPFICEQCGSAFASNPMMKHHVRVKHASAADKAICDICGKDFKHRRYLNKHMKRTHSQVEREHLCNVCPKAFKNPDHLKAHMRVHTGEKPFKCKECDKTFKQLCGLKAHKNAHEGKKTYVCSSCSTPFLYNSSLKNGLCNQCRKGGKITPEIKEIVKPSGLFDYDD